MGLFDNTTTTTYNSNGSQNVDPQYNEKNWNLFKIAENYANIYTPTVKPGPVPFNPTQQKAFDMMINLGTSGTDPMFTQAGDLYKQTGDYNPFLTTPDLTTEVQAQNFGINRGDIRNVGFNPVTAAMVDRSGVGDVSAQNAAAAQMSGEGLRNYVGMIDPTFQSAVLDQARNDIERQRQITQNAGAAAAAAAGAFGGSRHGVADAETNRAYGDTFARTAADLRMQGYNTALQNYQQDLGRQQQTGLFNADAALRAAMSNQGTRAQLASLDAQLAQQAGLANSEGALRAGMANQGYDARVALANADALNRNSMYNAGLAQNNRQFNSNQIMNSQQFNSNAIANQQAIKQAAANGLLNTGNTIFNNNMMKTGLVEHVGNAQNDWDTQKQQIDYENADALNRNPLELSIMLHNLFNGMPYGQQTSQSGSQTVKQRPSIFSMIGQGLSLASNFPGVGSFGGLPGGRPGMGGFGYANPGYGDAPGGTA